MAVSREFYEVAASIAVRSKDVPCKTGDIIYDPRFTSADIREFMLTNPEEEELNQILDFYDVLFAELDGVTEHFNCLHYVCDSADVNDPIECGDFIYFAGMITNEIGVLFMKSSHPWQLPSRAIIYGQYFEVRVCNGEQEVEVCPVNERVFKTLAYADTAIMKAEIKEMLRTSDRPRYIEDY